LVLLAANSSRAAYSTPGPEEAPDSSRLLGSVEQITAAARDGSIKASILVRQTTPTSSILTVAFRGTVSLMDWLVNLDGDLEDATTFLCSSPATNAEPAGPAISITAHKGLLRVAIAMTPTVCEKILNSVAAITNSTTSQKPVLLVTGHSAGGGVAALFTTHIRAQRREMLELFEAVHCVTFAAPPVLNSLAVAEAPSLPSAMSLNIVNFGDIVPRASKEYVRSLLTLYSEREGQVVESEWDFGEPESWNYGKNVLLMDVSTGDEEDEEPRQEASSQDGLDMRAFDVRNEVWKRLAFGNVKSHPMDLYLAGVHHLHTRSRI
jgi:Lipase (class 3)